MSKEWVRELGAFEANMACKYRIRRLPRKPQWLEGNDDDFGEKIETEECS